MRFAPNELRIAPVELIDLRPVQADFLDDVLAGLRKLQKELPAKYFYDQRGSQLFEEITRLPEYYLTRTEIGILRERAPEIASRIGDDAALIELGSGSSAKVRIILDQIRRGITYIPVDLSREFLESAAKTIEADYANATVLAVHGDYTKPFAIPRAETFRKRVVFFPGSTIGNLLPEEVSSFLAQTASMLQSGDAMIVGVDLKKDPAILHAAYNDSRGVTAEFNLNVLRRINEELAANFDLARFEPFAYYDEAKGRIEMHLRSIGDQTIAIAGHRFTIRDGETIHTENSYKYSIDDFRRLVNGTGFHTERVWTDSESLFSVYYLTIQRDR